jgi:hypothetical protein
MAYRSRYRPNSNLILGGIAMKLKQVRNSKGLSLRALSELADVPQRTIEDLERRDDGRVSTMIKLADALGVTLDELCRDEAAE